VELDLSFYPIVDLEFVELDEIDRKVPPVLSAGATIIQLRAKRAPLRSFLAAGRKLKALAEQFRVPLLINDRVDVCMSVGADGVHLGQEDFPPEEARSLLGWDRLIGLSVDDVRQAARAEGLPVDYLSLGAIFPTATKDTRVAGPGLIPHIRRSSRRPLCVIGGVTPANAADLVRAGASGVCAISALWKAADPGEAARSFVEAVARGRGETRA